MTFAQVVETCTSPWATVGLGALNTAQVVMLAFISARSVQRRASDRRDTRRAS